MSVFLQKKNKQIQQALSYKKKIKIQLISAQTTFNYMFTQQIKFHNIVFKSQTILNKLQLENFQTWIILRHNTEN